MKKWIFIFLILGIFVQANSIDRINKLLGHLKLDVKLEGEKESKEEIEKSKKEQNLLEKLRSLKPEQAIDHIINNVQQIFVGYENQKIHSLPGDKIASSCCSDYKIKIWDLKSKCSMFLESHKKDQVEPICPLSFNKLALVSRDGAIRIWDLETHRCIAILKGHKKPITSMCSLSNNKLASLSETLKIWDLETNKCVATLLDFYDFSIKSICSLSENKIALGCADGKIRMWDWHKDKVEIIYETSKQENAVPTYQFLPEIKSIHIFPENMYNVAFMDDCGSTRMGHFGKDYKINVNVSLDFVICVLPNNKVVQSYNRSLTIFDIKRNKQIAELKFDEDIASVCSLEENKLAIGLLDGTIKIIDLDILSIINKYLKEINLLAIPIEKLNMLAFVVDTFELRKIYIEQLKKDLILNKKYLPFHMIFQKLNFLTLKDIKDLLPIYYRNLYSSPSKTHVTFNVYSVMGMIEQHKIAFSKKEVQDFLLKIYKKEKEEISKGNYTFVHGRQKNLRFAGEIYKQLWNITKKDNVKNDFEFLRFDQKEKAVDQRKDYLFMNYALFANCHEKTLASTVSQYWLTDRSLYDPLFDNKKLFELFNMGKYYSKYENELDELERLHIEATPYGDIVLVSIPSDKMHLVEAVLPGGKSLEVYINDKLISDTKVIYETLKTKPDLVKSRIFGISNTIEFALPLEKAEALNPSSRIKYYSFYFLDDKKESEYNKLRDEIFSRIKMEYLRDKKIEKMYLNKFSININKNLSRL